MMRTRWKTNREQQSQKPQQIDLQIKQILVRGSSILFYNRLNLFVIANDNQIECWNQLEDNQLEENKQMNNFLNHDVFRYWRFIGSCDSHFLLKYDHRVLCIYDLINLKKTYLNISLLKFSRVILIKNFYLQIIGRGFDSINILTTQNKQVRKIMIKKMGFSKFLSGIFISDLYDGDRYFQLLNKSYKIIRRRNQQQYYCIPTKYSSKILISQQKHKYNDFALVHDKCSMRIKFKFQIESKIEDYIEVIEKNILIVLTTVKVFIYKTIDFNLINCITTKTVANYCNNHLIIYNNNVLKIIHTAWTDQFQQALQFF